MIYESTAMNQPQLFSADGKLVSLSSERVLKKIDEFYLVIEPESAKNLPDDMLIEKHLYHRHMGFIYLPVKPEELTPAQIIRLGNLREEYFDQVIDREFVREIYTFVYKLMSRTLSADQKARGIRLLDFGAGTGTLGNHIKFSGINGRYAISYHAVDINPKYENRNVKPYQTYSAISYDGAIPFSDDFFEVIVGLYVFHYAVPFVHVRELSRVLKSDGILVFNLYRPQIEHRNQVLSRIESVGLHWERIMFSSESAFHGLKHAPTEFYLCRK